MCLNNNAFWCGPNLPFYFRCVRVYACVCVCVCVFALCVRTVTLTNWCYKMSLQAIYSHLLFAAAASKWEVNIISFGTFEHSNYKWIQDKNKQMHVLISPFGPARNEPHFRNINTHKNIFVLCVLICLQWFHFWPGFALQQWSNYIFFVHSSLLS